MSIADPTPQELLTAVNAEILALVSGRVQETEVNHRKFKHLNLAELKELRTELEHQVSRENTQMIAIADISGSGI